MFVSGSVTFNYVRIAQKSAVAKLNLKPNKAAVLSAACFILSNSLRYINIV